jgi:hypothetical protein
MVHDTVARSTSEASLRTPHLFIKHENNVAGHLAPGIVTEDARRLRQDGSEHGIPLDEYFVID